MGAWLCTPIKRTVLQTLQQACIVVVEILSAVGLSGTLCANTSVYFSATRGITRTDAENKELDVRWVSACAASDVKS